MNIPQSSLEPFGYLGIPMLVAGIPESHEDVLADIWCNVASICHDYTYPLSIGEQVHLQNEARNRGASYTKITPLVVNGEFMKGYRFDITLNGIDYAKALNA